MNVPRRVKIDVIIRNLCYEKPRKLQKMRVYTISILFYNRIFFSVISCENSGFPLSFTYLRFVLLLLIQHVQILGNQSLK